MQDLQRSFGRQKNSTDYDAIIANFTDKIQERKEKEEELTRNLLQSMDRERNETEGVVVSLAEQLQQSKAREEVMERELEHGKKAMESILEELASIKAEVEKLKNILNSGRKKDIQVTRKQVERVTCYQEFVRIADRHRSHEAFRVSTSRVGEPRKDEPDQNIEVWKSNADTGEDGRRGGASLSNNHLQEGRSVVVLRKRYKQKKRKFNFEMRLVIDFYHVYIGLSRILWSHPDFGKDEINHITDCVSNKIH
ncbi:hypothetical protein FQA39_LY13797 [Lamprigera yunnana]|nr:hypothetical protein FQA39_LY13797 [Lamprigera yunnana]